MMELTINIPGLKELAEALVLLAGAKTAPAQHTAAREPVLVTPQIPSQPASVPQSVPVQMTVPAGSSEMTSPVPAPGGLQTQAPAVPVASAVPTTVVGQAYTQDQLAVAMTGLVDQGRMQVVMDILARMGVQALTEIPKERYPELVLLLREAGAVI